MAERTENNATTKNIREGSEAMAIASPVVLRQRMP